jgi:hypothetical protein
MMVVMPFISSAIVAIKLSQFRVIGEWRARRVNRRQSHMLHQRRTTATAQQRMRHLFIRRIENMPERQDSRCDEKSDSIRCGRVNTRDTNETVRDMAKILNQAN